MTRFVQMASWLVLSSLAFGCESSGDEDSGIGSKVNSEDGDASALPSSTNGDDTSASDGATDGAEDDSSDDQDDPVATRDESSSAQDGYEGGLFVPVVPPISVEPTATATTMPPSTPDDDQPNADNPLVECPSAVALGDDSRIDDFEDGDELILEVDNRSGGWYDYDDDTTQVEQLIERPAMAGAVLSSTSVMHVQSSGFPEYSGVGFGLRWTETGAEHCYYDASYYDGMRFWARGSAAVRLALQNPAVRPVDMGGTCPLDASCYDSHGYDFTVTSEWTLWQVSFSTMQQAGWGTPVGDFDPTKLFTVEFQFAAGAPYELWLDDVSFYKEGDELPLLPVVDGGAPSLPEGETDAAVTDVETSVEAEAGAPSGVFDAGLAVPSVDAG